MTLLRVDASIQGPRSAGSALADRVLDRFTAALGADQAGEIARVLAQRPGAIVYLNDPDSRYAPAARGVLEAALRRDYRLAGEARTGAKLFRVYALKTP